MAKSKNQKGKILYVERLLYDTGESRMVTMQDILDYLMDQGIQAERKSIYDDLSLLRELGMDVRYRHGKPGGYYQTGVDPDSLLGEIRRLTSGEKKAACKKDSGAEKNWPVREARFSYETEEGAKLLKEYLGGLPEVNRREDGVYTVTAKVSESPEFFGWLTYAGGKVRLETPKTMVMSYLEYLDTLSRDYQPYM